MEKIIKDIIAIGLIALIGRNVNINFSKGTNIYSDINGVC